MTRRIKFLIVIVALGLGNQPLSAQEAPLKDLVEHRRDRKLAFYPSTLRMINLSQNPDYNEMVNGIDKLLIYTLDSATKADKSYRQIAQTYTRLGFEEYAMAYGADMQLAILGKEGNDNEFVGYFGQNDLVVAFYLRGNVGWQKIPTLLQSMQQDDMINLFDLN